MNKFKKSQVLIFFILLLFLSFTPLLPSSLKPTYLYFISNFIIITLGAEAGLLSTLSKPLEDKTQSFSVNRKPQEAISEKKEASTTSSLSAVSEDVEKSESERVVSVTKVVKVQKGSSKPSIFFLENEENDEGMIDDEIEVEEEIEGLNGQELSAKAEVFIRNFYKQLKVQKERNLGFTIKPSNLQTTTWTQ